MRMNFKCNIVATKKAAASFSEAAVFVNFNANY